MVTRFTTKLQTAIELTGKWEVALAEIAFTKTWYTVPKNTGTSVYSCEGCRDIVPANVRHHVTGTDFHVEMTVPAGYYETAQSIIAAMNAEVEAKATQCSFPVLNSDGTRAHSKLEREKWPVFKYGEVKKKLNTLLLPGTSVIFDDVLSSLLGVPTKRI